MRLRNLFMILLLCMTVGLFAVSCSDGDTGPAGPPGPAGPAGPAGDAGKDGEDFTEPEPANEEGCDEFVERINFTAGGGPDVICGNSYPNRIHGGPGDDTIFGRAGNDELHGQDGDDTLHGQDGNDVLRGGPGEDTLEGGPGDDDLAGQAGSDVINGGAGDDTFWSEGAADGSDIFDGGAGADKIDFSMIGLVDHDTDDATPVQCPDDSSAIEIEISLALGYTDFTTEFDTYKDIENVTGTCGADTITGDDDNNVLDGGLGADTLAGGKGDDTYFNPETGDTITEKANEGADTISYAGLTAAAVTEIPDNIENYIGPNAATADITGNDHNNVITGGTMADTAVDAGAGDDTVELGKGANTIETLGAGKDTIIYNKDDGTLVVDAGGFVRADDKLILKGFPAADRVVTENPTTTGKFVVNAGGTDGVISYNGVGNVIITLTGVRLRSTDLNFE